MQNRHINDILVCCGSSDGIKPEYKQAARELGLQLVKHGYGIIYGGGNNGLMGAVASPALEKNGCVTSIYPKAFAKAVECHKSTNPHIATETLFQRKEEMLFRSQAAIILPGGFGSLDELFELTAANDAQRYLEPEKPLRPVIILNTMGYYDLALAMIKHAVSEGFIKPQTLAMIHVVSKPKEAVKLLNRLNHRDPRPASILNPP